MLQPVGWPLPSAGAGRYVAHLLALAALIHIHFSSFAFIPLTGLWLVFFYRRLDWRLVVLGGLVSALTFIPYFSVDAGNEWRNVNLFLELIASPATTDLQAAQAGWSISTGLDLGQLTGADRYPDFLDQTPNVRWLFVVGGVLSVAGLAIALVRAVNEARGGLDEPRVAGLMAATLFLAPVLFLTRHNTGVAHHYLTTTFPSQFMLAGWVVSLLWQRRTLVLSWVMTGVGVLFVLAQAYEAFSILRFVESHHTPFGFGTPLSYELAAVDAIHRIADERGAAEIILLSEGDEPRMYEMPAVADVLFHDQAHRAVDVVTTLVFPANPAVYWVTREMTDGERMLQGLTPELASSRVRLREGVRSFRFFHWPGGPPQLADLAAPDGGPYTWENGVTLAGYRIEGELTDPGVVRWSVAWSPREPLSEDVYLSLVQSST